MSYAFDAPHSFHALSRRKSRTCSTCLRDLSHPNHQDSLAVEMTDAQHQEHDSRSAAELTRGMAAPLGDVSRAAGEIEKHAPLFAGTEASGQVRMF